MNDKTYKRLVRLLVISWVTIVVLLLIIASLGSYQISQVRSIALENGAKTVVGPEGPAGVPGDDGATIVGPKGDTGARGEQGEQGVAGLDGKNGEQGIQGEKGDKGDQGPQGPAGQDGRVVYVRENPRTKDLECKFIDWDEWQPIEECQ